MTFLLFITTAVSAQQDDTTLIKRPQYFGIFVGRLQFTAPDHYLFQAHPKATLGIQQVLKLTVGDAMHAGLFFTYPFMRRMEWDAGFGVFAFQRQKIIAEVTDVSTGPSNNIVSMHTWIDNRSLIVTEFRSHFSVILIQREKYSVLLGAGGWLASNRMESYLNPGSVGVEGNITAYYRYHKSSFVQLHVSPGIMRNGYYINATLGICYQNQKTMRARPKHYYVRTYDPEE
ncbi:MAG: hypothetical protein M3R17_02625 [Bacteroidota bacterium]|nr:hypothetical protein [Bacteroidota bacterium]